MKANLLQFAICPKRIFGGGTKQKDESSRLLSTTDSGGAVPDPPVYEGEPEEDTKN